MTPPRPTLPLAAAAVLALALCAATARADLDVGEPAPSVATLTVVRGPAPDASARLGRVVLLEFFSTKCPHCQAEVAHLNALHRAFASRGLLVAAASHEAAPAAQAFARDWGVAYALVTTGADVLRDFDVPSFPRAVLLDPLGRVLWRGHPSGLGTADLEAALARGGLRPAVPPALDAAVQAVVDGDWAGTRARLDARVREAPEATDATRAANALSEWIGWLVHATRAAAERDLDAGRPFDAVVTLRALEAATRGTPAAAEAGARAAGIEEDPVARREVEAGRAWAKARALRASAGDREALEAFRAVVASWPGTRAAARAAVWVRDLERATRRPAPSR